MPVDVDVVNVCGESLGEREREMCEREREEESKTYHPAYAHEPIDPSLSC